MKTTPKPAPKERKFFGRPMSEINAVSARRRPAYLALAGMPPLSHWPNRPEPFDWRKSEVGKFIRGVLPDAGEKEIAAVLNTARKLSILHFDPESKLWEGTRDTRNLPTTAGGFYVPSAERKEKLRANFRKGRETQKASRKASRADKKEAKRAAESTAKADAKRQRAEKQERERAAWRLARINAGRARAQALRDGTPEPPEPQFGAPRLPKEDRQRIYAALATLPPSSIDALIAFIRSLAPTASNRDVASLRDMAQRQLGVLVHDREQRLFRGIKHGSN